MEYLKIAFINSPWIMMFFLVREILMCHICYYGGKYMAMKNVLSDVYLSYKEFRTLQKRRYEFKFKGLLIIYWFLTLLQMALEYFKII